MTRAFVLICVFALVAVAGGSGSVMATVDPGFDEDGIAIPDLHGGLLDLMLDGSSVVAAGYSGDTTPPSIAVFRFDAAGALDGSFGGGDGVVSTDLGGAAEGIALRAGGGYWVAGYASGPQPFGGPRDFVLGALTEAGVPDPAFGTDGFVRLDHAGEDTATAFTVDPEGRLLIAGFSYRDGESDALIARFSEDGEPDGGFGAGGTVRVDLGGPWDQVTDLQTTSIGEPVIVGSASGDGYSELAVVRLEVDGDPDPTFSGDGIHAPQTLFGSSAGETVELLESGKVLIGATVWGSPTSGGLDIALVRLLPDGDVDTSFGSSGSVVTDITNEDRTNGLAILDGGAIMLTGSVERDRSDYLALRYTKTGQLDPLFGHQITNLWSDRFNDGDDGPSTLEVMSDGRYLMAGSSHVSLGGLTGYRIAIVRFTAPTPGCSKVTSTRGQSLVGTAGPDILCALGGDNVVRGLGGADLLYGGRGNDRLRGGGGNDRLLGESGDDRLSGGDGRDTCRGGEGRDRIVACER